jgi:ABC-type transport system involved in multi-copper enzyme maturation permease subunit
MMRRAFILYRTELAKAVRQKFPYAGLLLVTAMAVAGAFMTGLRQDGESDYGFIAYVTPMALNLLGVIVLMAFCVGQVASEFRSGTIRAMLTRPVLRHDFLVAKLLIGVSYAALMTACVTVVSWAAALAFGDLAGVTIGGEIVYTDAEMLTAYFLGALLSLAPQTAAVALAVMLAVITRNTASAIGSAVGLWLIAETVKHPLGIESYVFTTHCDGAWKVFTNRCVGFDSAWVPDLYFALGSSAATAAAFVLVAWFVLHRRDILS